MIHNPKFGWCKFQLGTFEGHPSYLTDVPIDMLDGFYQSLLGKDICIRFDEEGSEFCLILSNYNIYIIAEREKTEFYQYEDKTIKDLALEVTNDIEKNIQDWADQFCLDCCTGEKRKNLIQERVLILTQKIQMIRNLIKTI